MTIHPAAQNISTMKDDAPQHQEYAQGDAKDLGEVIDLDEAVLRAQGHDAELNRSFSWVGALGLAFRFVVL